MDKPHKSFESWNSRKLNPKIGKMNNQMKVERFGQWMKLGKLQTQNMQKMLSGTMNELEKVGKYGTWEGKINKIETMNKLGEVRILLEQNSQNFRNIDIAWN